MPDLVPALSVVLGLLLAFRANTSYARYYEGRQLWETLISNARNLARLVWVSIPERTQNDHLEKMRCMKLLLAFAVSTKHHLRREFGCDYYDLEHLLPPHWIPAAADDLEDPTAVNTPISKHGDEGHEEEQPLLSEPPRTSYNSATKNKKFVSDEDLPDVEVGEMSLPLEILYRMSLYIAQAKNVGKIDGTFSSNIISHLNTMNDCLAGLERIANTPIPGSYHIHL